jgi:hypothetical protein
MERPHPESDLELNTKLREITSLKTDFRLGERLEFKPNDRIHGIENWSGVQLVTEQYVSHIAMLDAFSANLALIPRVNTPDLEGIIKKSREKKGIFGDRTNDFEIFILGKPDLSRLPINIRNNSNTNPNLTGSMILQRRIFSDTLPQGGIDVQNLIYLMLSRKNLPGTKDPFNPVYSVKTVINDLHKHPHI